MVFRPFGFRGREAGAFERGRLSGREGAPELEFSMVLLESLLFFPFEYCFQMGILVRSFRRLMW